MLYPYRKSKQIEKYIGQFIRVFKGFQVPLATDPSIVKPIPVVYGSMDRVVASMLKKNETFTNQRVPIMAVNFSGLATDPRRKMPNTHVDEVVVGEKFYNRLTGVPFLMELELSIYADSNTQLLEILEQILLVFHPRITLNIDSSILSNEYISEITLESISPDIQYPLGQNKQVVMMNLNFSVPVMLRYPTEERDEFIERVRKKMLEQDTNDVVEINPDRELP